MDVFNLNKDYAVKCQTKSTRQGFKHIAMLYKNGLSVASASVNYLNRSWENYTYQTAIFRVIEKNFNNTEAIKFKKLLDKQYNR